MKSGARHLFAAQMPIGQHGEKLRVSPQKTLAPPSPRVDPLDWPARVSGTRHLFGAQMPIGQHGGEVACVSSENSGTLRGGGARTASRRVLLRSIWHI